MRLTFLILLLANLGLFIWSSGYLGERAPGREPARLAMQVSPEQLQVNAPSAVRICEQVDALDSTQLGSLRSQFDARRDVELRSIERKAPPSYWVAIPGLESKELAERKRGELRKLGVTDISVLDDALHGPWAVVLGTFSDAAAGQKMLDELAPRGVRSARLVSRDTPSRFSVTLSWPDPVNAARAQLLQEWLSGLPAGHAVRRSICAGK